MEKILNSLSNNFIKKDILINYKTFFNSLFTVKTHVFLFILFSFSVLNAATFTVSNLNNAGTGSLRQAIIDANGAGGGGHNINFTVSGIINLSSHLPVITNNNITIDGAGQTITVSANGGDISRYVFRGNAEAVRLMRRFLQINCPTCGTLSPTIDVRMYWNPVEQSDAGTAMDNLMTANSITGTKVWEWFKVVHDANDIPANLTEAGITDNSGTAMTWATPDETGVELNGVSYVQFNNITTLSTFGGGWHVNQVDATILPVELLYLDATAVDNEFIRIDWATATEINNEGFELQRSEDGLNFETIAWIDGNGNSNNIIEYSYDDKEVTTSVYYYRLKQIDFNGDFEFTKIVSASITKKDESLFEVNLIPNPSEGFGKVAIYSSREEVVQLEIFNSIGARILSKNVRLDIGTNEVKIDKNNYAAGVYNVVIYRADKQPISLKWIIVQ